MLDNVPITIKNDNNATIIFSSFIKNKDIRYLNAVIDYINEKKNENRIANIKITVEDINDLFYKVNGKSIIEFIIENDNFFGYDTFSFLAKNIKTLKECINLNYYKIVDYIYSEEFLLSEYEPGKNIFEFLLENNILTHTLLGNIYFNNECVEKIFQKDDSLLKYLSGFTLSSTKIGNITTLEYLFQKNMINKDIINSITDDAVYELCIKYHREDLFMYLQANVLCQERNGKTILEILLDNRIYPELKFISNKKIIKVLIDRKLFNYFIDESEINLLKEVEDGLTVLDVLLYNGITPNNKFYSKKESLNIFIKHGRFDLMTNYSLDILISLYNLNESYLDLLLKQKKEGLNFNLTKLNTYSSNTHNRAMFYIIIARHGFINHIDSLDVSVLTKNKGELFKELMDIDSELTLNTILSDSTKQNIDIVFLLKLYGINQKDIKIDLKSHDIVNDYYNGFNREFTKRELSEEALSLIEEFRSLMLSDNLSDKEMIEAMVTSYTYLISINSEYGISELMKLIEIKKNKKDFVIKKSYNGSFYHISTSSINLENICLNTLNHETGHALYHLLTDAKVPDGFEKILYDVRKNPEILMKVDEYSKKYREILFNVAKLVDEVYMKDYQLSEYDKETIEQFINRKKEDHKKIYLEKGYDEETINTIFNQIYTVEEYIEQDKRIKREELIDAIIRSEYGSFMTISDIIDAIYNGKFRSGELINKDGNIILPCPGHGIAYYSKGTNWSFDELIANFSAILKSPDRREILSYLKRIVGEEFVNYMENYYKNEITLSNKDLSVKEESVL